MLTTRDIVNRTLDLTLLAGFVAFFWLLVQDTALSLEVIRRCCGFDAPALAASTIALLIYLLAHFFRAIRLQLIIGLGRIRFTALLGYHSFLAFTTAAVPWKAGELLRVTEAYRLLNNDARGLFAVWVDRLFDVGVILIVLFPWIFLGRAEQAVHVVFWAAASFLLASFAILLFVPGAVASFSRALLLSRSNRSMLLLRFCAAARNMLNHFPRIDRATFALLLLLTVAIWICEIGTIFFVLYVVAELDGSLLADVMTMFASLLAPPEGRTPTIAVYRLICTVGLALLLSVSFVRYLRLRLSIWRAPGPKYKYRLIRRPQTPRLSETPSRTQVLIRRGRTR